ncbi:MAG: hypothetical protein V4597_17990 [Pseudomonadota bacterium]
MARFDENLLDEMSKDFATALFEYRPDWRQYAKLGQAIGEPECWLDVLAPSPTGEILLVTTEGDEITVAFGGHHQHFTWSSHPDEISEDPIGFIDAIVTEKIFAASARDASRGHGAWPMRPGESLPRADYALGGATEISVRSWLGTYDLDEQLGQ